MVTRDSITISWGPSKDDGGAEMIGYVVERRDASRNVWQRVGYNDASTFTYTATGLIEDASYHFRVLAENSVGMSPPLTTVDAIVAKSPYTRPDTPEGPLLTKVASSTSIDCTWQPPMSDGGTTLTGYLIQRRDISRPIWVKVRLSSLSSAKDTTISCIHVGWTCQWRYLSMYHQGSA